METVLHPREASAGDVNHLSEKDYQIKKHPVHSMNFPLPYCEIAPRLQIENALQTQQSQFSTQNRLDTSVPCTQNRGCHLFSYPHSRCLVAFVKQFTLKHEWKLYTFATVLHRYTLMNHCSPQWLCLNVSKRLYRLTPMTLSFKLIQ